MWYSVDILMKSSSSKVEGIPLLWEEVIIIVEAEGEADARTKAENIARLDEVEYTSISGENIEWTYERILQVYEIRPSQIADGTEVFSRFLRDSEVKSLSMPFDELP